MKISNSYYRSLAVAACGLLAGAANAAALTAGNILILRVGDGVTTPTSNAAAPATLEEYTRAGGFVQNIAVPSVGANRLTLTGNSTTEGGMHVSANGQYITFGGYDVAVGVASPAATAANVRVIARVDLAGNVDTTTRFDNSVILSTGNVRSVISDNGSQFWLTTSDRGIVYLGTFGASQPGVQLNTAPTNTREIQIYSGQLYISSASTPFRGVSTLGTGLPTTNGQTATLLTGFPGSTGGAAFNAFQFNSATQLFATDSGTSGVEEWKNNAGTWSRNSNATLAGGNPGLVLGSDGTQNVVWVADNGVGFKKAPATSPVGSLTTVYTAPGTVAIRGIVMVPGAAAAVSNWHAYDATTEKP